MSNLVTDLQKLVQRIRFLEEFVIPAFYEINCSDQTPEARVGWMRKKATEGEFDEKLMETLLTIYGGTTVEEAKDEKKQLQAEKLAILQSAGNLARLEAPPAPAQASLRNDVEATISRALRMDPDERVIETLLSKFGADYYNISTGKVPDVVVREIYRKAQLSLTTRTKQIIQQNHPYCLFDSIIAVGQGNSVVLKVMFKAVCCSAKIGSLSDMEKEVKVAKLFPSSPTLMNVLDVISMSENRLAMITPLYSSSLHDFTGRRSLELFVRVAICTLLSIRAFNCIGYCHGDIKPKNLMVNNNSKFVTVIDFGESAPYGVDMMKDSMVYPLDCVRTASLQYDLTCLASTLWELWQGKVEMKTRDELRVVSASCDNKLVGAIITACLDDDPSITTATANPIFNIVLNLVVAEAGNLLPDEIKVECDTSEVGGAAEKAEI